MIQILYPDEAGVMKSITLLDLETKHASKSTPTDHPVETGATITDHIRVELQSVTLRAFVTDSLLEAMPDLMGEAQSANLTVGSAAAPFAVSGFTRRPERVDAVFVELRELQAARRLVTIVTGRQRYESMVLADVQFPESNRDGVEITIEAREVRVVTTRTAQAPRPRTTRGHRNSEAGQTTTQAATTTDQTPPRTTRSTALQLLDLI
jgi:hypothetical protein